MRSIGGGQDGDLQVDQVETGITAECARPVRHVAGLLTAKVFDHVARLLTSGGIVMLQATTRRAAQTCGQARRTAAQQGQMQTAAAATRGAAHRQALVTPLPSCDR